MNFRITVFVLLFLTVSPLLFSQKMEVIRTSAVDRNTPVTNVFVDAENQKWVGNFNGLYQVFSPKQGNAVELKPEDWSLLQTHDGNYDLRLPLDGLIGQMGKEGLAIKSEDDQITAATYNENTDQLWVGTYASGLFEFKTKPALRLVKRHHEGNSKLPNNFVNTLFLDNRGMLWVGTYGGALVIKGSKWDVKEKGFSFSAFAQNGADVWAMGDNLLWKVNSRGSWTPIDLDETAMENDVADIAFDLDGLLWVVSDIVARFDPATEETTVFGPAIGFTSQDVYCIAVDQDNGVWIGTNDKGLYLIQKASTLYLACDVVKDLSCAENAKDAALKVNVSGGAPPYKYVWSGGLTGDSPTNVGPGEYALTVTDSRGKSNNTKVVLKDPVPKLTLKQGKQASPDGTSDGSATVNVTGGKAGYSYTWDSGEKAATAFALGEGMHTVTVTDKNGCSVTGSIEIGREVAGLNAAIAIKKEIRCAGGADAAIQLKVDGGKEPFTYAWSQDGLDQNRMSPGNYQVTVTDGIGQTAVAAVDIIEPQSLEANAVVDASATTNNSDGQASVQAKGGTGKYTFKWSNGASSNQATQLPPGEHSVTVTDENGCEAVASVTITEDILPLSVNISQKEEVKCAGGKDAVAEANIKGGKGPFQYNWSGGEANGKSVSQLPAGSYSLTLTDAAGSTTVADIQIKEPKELTISASVKSPASTGNADGKATVKASGGTGDLTYTWDSGETGRDAIKLGPGEHSVSVTDENGCTQTTSVSISENILALQVELSQEGTIKCAGDKTAGLIAEVSGGKGPFSFEWNKPGLSSTKAEGLAADEYSLTVTDVEGTTAVASIKIKEPPAVMIAANVIAPASTDHSDGRATAVASGGTGRFTYQWDNSETTKTAEKLAPGSHNITVTDEAGCTGVAVVDVTENILELAVSISEENPIKCAGQSGASLKVSVIGGKGPFSYDWDQAAAKGENPNGLSPGSFTLTVTDASGQTANASFQIKEPATLTVSLIKSRPTTTEDSNNGRALIKVGGGTGSYRYEWDNGETGATAEALPGGLHTVKVTDENGCEASLDFETKVRIIPELSSNNLQEGAIINLNKIYFLPDSTQMEASSIPTVDELFDFLKENPDIVVEVGGHTNNIPSHEYCDALSTARSKSVAQYLLDKGIPASQLRYKGYGKRNPIATNSTPEGRAKNQRVEIKILQRTRNGG